MVVAADSETANTLIWSQAGVGQGTAFVDPRRFDG
jgi:hypothetical protein